MDGKLLFGRNFEFREKPSEKVSLGWKMSHIISYIPIGFSGIFTHNAFGRVIKSLDNHCALYSNPSFTLRSNKSDIYIDILTSDWSKMSLCEFCECASCSSFILAITWITFFTLCGRGGSSMDWLV